MAIDLTQVYPQQVDASTPAYPLGKARNVTSVDDNNATPLDEVWMNDHFGFQQAILREAGVVPSGQPDTATASQYLEAIKQITASSDKSSASVVMEDGEYLDDAWREQFDDSSVFGQTGVKFLADFEDGVHNGWGSYVQFDSGKLAFIWRKAANHAILNTAALYCKDSFDGGKSWINERVILSSTTNDLRPDPLKLMGDNRAGTFINRASTTSGAYFKPLFITTDDEGETWQTKEVDAVAPYTFQSSGGLIEYPASVGGHDTYGFIAYGFLSGGGLDAFTTVDNGETWAQVDEVAIQSGEVTALSEWAGTRLGNTDRWVFLTRSRVGSTWNQKLIIWVTNNPLNWGTWRDSGLAFNGNPPAIVYDDITNDVVILSASRADRAIGAFPEDTLLEARINANTLYSNNGVIGSLTSYRVIAAFPNWFTAYLAPAKINGKWSTALTCGEFASTDAVQIMLGDFASSAGEISKLTRLQVENNTKIKAIDKLNSLAIEQLGTEYPFIVRSAVDGQIYAAYRPNGMLIKGPTSYDISSNVPINIDCKINSSSKFNVGTTSEATQTTHNARITISVDSATSPAVASTTGSNSARKHIVFVNGNGAVGSITTTDMTTSYGTTSDYRAKEILGAYALALEQVDSLKIYNAVFKADPNEQEQPMLLAHELQEIAPYAVMGEKDEIGEDGEPLLQQVDYSKLVPLLIASIQGLRKTVQNLETQINKG